jgi:hypothetical protein
MRVGEREGKEHPFGIMVVYARQPTLWPRNARANVPHTIRVFHHVAAKRIQPEKEPT